MQFMTRTLAPFVFAGAACAAVALAPMASASPLACTDVGSATQCGSPGNSQITANAPQVQSPPQIIIIHRGHR